jgi:bacterioferritin
VGTRERESLEALGVNIPELISLLNKAFADEWLAYYQYWIGAQVAQGILHKVVSDELEEHAKEELKHADMLVERIIQLGGTPVLEPKEWYTVANCRYEAPSNPNIHVLLEQNIRGERCAIGVYKTLLKYVQGKDPITYDLIVKILAEEVEHEEDLETILRDLG